MKFKEIKKLSVDEVKKKINSLKKIYLILDLKKLMVKLKTQLSISQIKK